MKVQEVGSAGGGSLFHHDGTMVPSRWNDGSITMEQTKVLGVASKNEGRGESMCWVRRANRGACKASEYDVEGVREEGGGREPWTDR